MADEFDEKYTSPANQARNLQASFDDILKDEQQYKPGRFFASALTSKQQSELKDLKKQLVTLVKKYKSDFNLRTLTDEGLGMINQNISNITAMQMSKTGTHKKIDKIYKDYDDSLNKESGCGGCSPFSTRHSYQLYEDA